MVILPGYLYHLKDDYFALAKDNRLMINYKDTTRPAFYCVKDTKTQLLWFVPLSSRTDKYKRIFQNDMEKYNECLKITFARVGGSPVESAFLIQNMFPTIEKYISHIHMVGSTPVRVDIATQRDISNKMTKIKALYNRGYKFIATDIIRLEKLMLEENFKEKYSSLRKAQCAENVVAKYKGQIIDTDNKFYVVQRWEDNGKIHGYVLHDRSKLDLKETKLTINNLPIEIKYIKGIGRVTVLEKLHANEIERD